DLGAAVWSAGLDEKGAPIALNSKNKKLTFVSTNGAITKPNLKTFPPVAKKPAAPKLGQWLYLPLTSLVNGTAAQYQQIDAPTSLDKLGQYFGYGWYKFTLGETGGADKRIISPLAQDRLHVYSKGNLKQIIGEGAGAKEAPLKLNAQGELVVLA